MKKMNVDIFLVNALLFCLPLVYLSGQGSYNSLRFFFFGTLVLMLAVFAVVRFIRYKWLVPAFFKSWYSYGLLAYLVSFVLVSATSINPALSFWSTFERTDGAFAIIFVSFFALSVYTIVATSDRKVIKQFLASSVLGAMVVSFFILFSPDGFSLLRMKWLVGSRGGAMFGNSSVAASYVLWNIFFAAVLFVKSDSNKKRIFWGFASLFLVLSPLFVNWQLLLGRVKYTGLASIVGSARGAFLGILFGVLVALGVWLFLQKDKIKRNIGIGLLALMCIGTISCAVLILEPSSTLHQKFIENVGENRFFFWDSAFKGFAENPILGLGPNNFGYSLHKYFDPRMLLPQNGGEILTDEAHNILVETLAGGGVLLLACLFFLLASVVAVLIKLAKKDKLSTLEAALFVGALAGWFLQAQFVFDSISSLAMLFLVAGIAYGALADRPELKHKPLPAFSTKEISLVVVSVCASLVLFYYVIVLPYAKSQLMYKTYTSHLPLRASLWQDFSGITPMGNSHDSVLIFNMIFNSYDAQKQNIAGWDTAKKAVVLEELDAIIDRLFSLSLKYNNYNISLMAIKLSYTRMYISRDTPEPLLTKTHDLIEKMIAVSPTDPQPLWVKAQLLMAEKKFPEAKDVLEKTLLLEPNLEYTHTLILQLAKVMNDKAYYDFALKRAGVDVPGFAGN